MGHRQHMTPAQLLKWDSENYAKRLQANRGLNFEYWSDKHTKMLENGWELYSIVEKSTRQWSQIFKKYATSSVLHAKKFVEQLRSEGNYARIICGFEKNVQRTKMYSIIYKPKNKG